jgi:hypothetical protein
LFVLFPCIALAGRFHKTGIYHASFICKKVLKQNKEGVGSSFLLKFGLNNL